MSSVRIRVPRTDIWLLVDAEDVERLSEYELFRVGGEILAKKGDGRAVSIPAALGLRFHVPRNGDWTDMRRANLERKPRTSRYKGVATCSRGRWYAAGPGGKRFGPFKTEEEALAARLNSYK